MGHEFERIAVQAYDRRAVGLGLPLASEIRSLGGEGPAPRARRDRLSSPPVLKKKAVRHGRGEVGPEPPLAWASTTPTSTSCAGWQTRKKWANQALAFESPLLYVAAGGFEDGFQERVEEDGHPVTCGSLDDLYAA